MQKIKLITDSTCDLSRELIKEYQIDVIPLFVNFKDDSFLDGVDISVGQMYARVERDKELPKTAAPAPGAFAAVFKKYLDQGFKIIYTGIGSKFSASLNSAMVAKDLLKTKDVYLLDSENLSTGSGILLLKAGEMIKKGHSAEEIKKTLETLVPKVRSQFVIHTLDYLYKGGRLNALSAFFGSVLKIKPIIKVRNGEMLVGKKGRGRIRNTIKMMINDMLSEADDIDKDFMMITHSLASEDAQWMREEIENNIKIKNLYETPAGCVISSHCGKGTIGVLYLLK